MLDVVLYQPEIPPNTGNIIRLCANTGASLHLIEPLGFEMDDKQLRRAGLDYHEWADVRRWKSVAQYTDEMSPERLFMLSTHHTKRHTDARFTTGDAVVFGPETRGLPIELRESVEPAQRLCLPMRPSNRSLNLSNAVAVVVYEAWRQMDFGGSA